MAPIEALAALAATLRDLSTWFSNEEIPHAVIGGVAASLQGEPRLTRDVDVVILAGTRDPAALVAQAAAYGFDPRRPDAARFAERSRVLLLQHQADGISVDISLGLLPFEEELIARAKRATLEGVEFTLATPEYLIVMKALAFRPRDIADIESLLNANPRLDLALVRSWVTLLAAALDAPEIAERLEDLLAAQRPAKATRKKRPPRKP